MTQTLLDEYRAIERTSRDMVDAARRSQWDEVARLQAVSQEKIEQLRTKASAHTWSKAEHAQKHHIMLSILRHDAQIRSLAEPSLADLELLFHRPGPAQLH